MSSRNIFSAGEVLDFLQPLKETQLTTGHVLHLEMHPVQGSELKNVEPERWWGKYEGSGLFRLLVEHSASLTRCYILRCICRVSLQKFGRVPPPLALHSS